ncbi:MAG: hypothetical protein AB1608_08550 [Thermoproteota archaeon]
MLITTPAFAQLSDKTGLRTTFDVEVGGKIFVIDTIANFDVQDVKFEDGKIVLSLQSSLENNFGEMQIPKNVTSGQLRFYLDGKEIGAKMLQNEKISFVTLSFNGTGAHTLEVVGEYPSSSDQPKEDVFTDHAVQDDTNKIMMIISVVAVLLIAGAASTFVFYFKKKKTV